MTSEDSPLRDLLVALSNGQEAGTEQLIALCSQNAAARVVGYWRTFVHIHEPGTLKDSSGARLGHGYVLWEHKGGVTFTWSPVGLQANLSDLLMRGFMDDFFVIEETAMVPQSWSAKLDHIPRGWIDSNLDVFDGQGRSGYLGDDNEIYPVHGFESDEGAHQTLAAWGSRSGHMKTLTLQVDGFDDLSLYPQSEDDEAAVQGLLTLLGRVGG